ncbi:putative disease resistance protein RGA1 [Cocos nucifera]|nr:putative disease resistance protein RGA1 [Cocos nucifera]
MISEGASKSILSPILKSAENQAATLLLEEFKLQLNVKDEIEKLKERLKLIYAFLDDAELKQQHDEKTKVWVGNLQDVAYDAEDVLDEVAPEASQLKLMGAQMDWIGQVSDFVLSCFTCSIMSSCLFHRGIAIGIKEIREKLDEIEKSGTVLGIQQSGSQHYDIKKLDFSYGISDGNKLHR